MKPTTDTSSQAARTRGRRDRLVPVGIAAGVLIAGATTLALTNDTASDTAGGNSSSAAETIASATGADTPTTSDGAGTAANAETGEATTGSGDSATTTATATVERGQLVETKKFNGTVNFGDPWQLATTASGIITEVPEAGTTLQPGDVALRINNLPVTLVEGGMPMYRTLEKVNVKQKDEFGTRKTLMSGFDVLQLQNYLLAQGFNDKGRLQADGVYGDVTVKAVKEWQKAVGFPISGKVDSTQIVFTDAPLRVAETVRVGTTFAGLKVTETDPAVFVSTAARERNLFAVGTEVTIEQPDGSRLTGVVDRQERGTADDGSQTWKARIKPNEALATDIEAVTVETARVLADDALLVPTSALIALAEGGYAVEVANGGNSQLVAVEIVDVLEDRAAISGDLNEGDTVVIAQ